MDQLQGLVSKLVHPLLEVRVRSLDNLVSKLKNGLLSMDSLVTNRVFLQSLIGWFSFRETKGMDNKNEEVLNLLAKLAGSQQAATNLINLGGLTVLQKLKSGAATRTQNEKIDELMNILSSSQFTNSYSHSYAHDDSCLSLSQSQTLPTVDKSTSVPLKFSKSDGHFYEPSKNQSTNYGYLFGATYFEKERELLFTDSWRFPSVELTQSDQKFLFRLSLRFNEDSKAIKMACYEFTELVVRDFPPEVFIEKIHVFEALINVVKSPRNVDLAASALKALSQMLKCLRASMRFHSDVSFVGTQQNSIAVDFSLERYYQYPQHLVTVQRNNEKEADEFCETPRLLPSPTPRHKRSFPVAQIGHLIFTSLLPLLRIEEKAPFVLPVLFDTSSVLFPRKHLSTDMTKGLCSYTKELTKTLEFFGHSKMVEHSYSVVTSIIGLTLRILEKLSHAEEGLKVGIPKNLLLILSKLLRTEEFGVHRPDFQSKILKLLDVFDEVAVKEYTFAREVIDSIEQCSVLAQKKASDTHGISISDVLKTVPGVFYCQDHLDAVISSLFEVFRMVDKIDVKSTRECIDYFLLLLGSDVSCVSQRMYERLLELIQTKASSVKEFEHFLTNPDFIFELVMFGMSKEKLSKLSTDILISMSAASPLSTSQAISPFHHILQLQLFSSLKKNLFSNLCRNLSDAQILFSKVRLMFHKEANERMKANREILAYLFSVFDLRFSNDHPKRGLCRALKDHFHTLAASLREDCFNGRYYQKENDQQFQKIPISQFFQVKDVENLVAVFCNTSLEPNLRNSAASQLCSILSEEPYLHILESQNLFECIETELASLRNISFSSETYRCGVSKNEESGKGDRSDEEIALPLTDSSIQLAESSLELLLLISKGRSLVNERENGDSDGDESWREGFVKLSLPYAFHPNPELRLQCAKILCFLTFDQNLLKRYLKPVEPLFYEEDYAIDLQKENALQREQKKLSLQDVKLLIPDCWKSNLSFPFSVSFQPIISAHSKRRFNFQGHQLVEDSTAALQRISEAVCSYQQFWQKEDDQKATTEEHANVMTPTLCVSSFLSSIASCHSHVEFLNSMRDFYCLCQTDQEIRIALANMKECISVFQRFWDIIPTSEEDDLVLIAIATLTSFIISDLPSSSPSAELNSVIFNRCIPLLQPFDEQNDGEKHQLKKSERNRMDLKNSLFDLLESYLEKLAEEKFKLSRSDFDTILSLLLFHVDKSDSLSPRESPATDGIQLSTHSLKLKSLRCLLVLCSQRQFYADSFLRQEERLLEILRILKEIAAQNRMQNMFNSKSLIRYSLMILLEIAKVLKEVGRDTYGNTNRLLIAGNLKWLLRLLADREAFVVTIAYSIISRLLTTPNSAQTLFKSHPILSDWFIRGALSGKCSAVRAAALSCVSSLVGSVGEAIRQNESKNDGNIVKTFRESILPKIIEALPEMLSYKGCPSFFVQLFCLLQNLLFVYPSKISGIFSNNNNFLSLLFDLVSLKSLRDRYNTLTCQLSPLLLDDSEESQSQWDIIHSEDAYLAVTKILDIFHILVNQKNEENSDDTPSDCDAIISETSTKLWFLNQLISETVIHRLLFLLPSPSNCHPLSSNQQVMLISLFRIFQTLFANQPQKFREFTSSLNTPMIDWSAGEVAPSYLLDCFGFLLKSRKESKEEKFGHDGNKGSVDLRLKMAVCRFLTDLCDAHNNELDRNSGSEMLFSNLLALFYDLHSTSEYFTGHSTEEKRVVSETLSALLAMNYQAKVWCLQCKDLNLPKWICSHLSELHNLLTMQLISDENSSKETKQRMQSDLCLSLRMLKNYLYNFDQKGVFAEHNLSEIICDIWQLCMTSQRLLEEILGVLLNFISGCDSAKYSVLTGRPFCRQSASKDGKANEISVKNPQKVFKLMTFLSQLCKKPRQSLEVMRLSFECMKSICLFKDAVFQIVKSGLISFSLERLEYLAKNRKYQRQQILLGFLANVAYSEEGQRVMFRTLVPSQLDFFLDFMSSKNECVKTTSTLVIRNLSFYKAVKVPLLSNGRLLSILLANADAFFQSVETKAPQTTSQRLLLSLYSVNALWSLVYDNQKGIVLSKSQAKPALLNLKEMLMKYEEQIIAKPPRNSRIQQLEEDMDVQKLLLEVLDVVSKVCEVFT